MAGPSVYVQSVSSPDLTRRKKYYRIGIGLYSAGTPTYTALANGGLLIDLTTLVNVQKEPRGSLPNSPLPGNTDIVPEIIPAGYEALLLINPTSPTLKNYILQIFNSFATELGNGSNIPAALFGTTTVNAPPFVFKIGTKNWR